VHYALSRQGFTDLTREEHRGFFDGNIHVERARLQHRSTGFDVPRHFDEHKTTLKTKPEIKATLSYLARVYTLGIISSSREDGLNTYLLNNGLAEAFAFVYGVETHKLKAKKFNLVKRRFGLKNHEISFVTDTLGDIREANGAGIRVVAVDFGFHDRARLERGNPAVIVSRFADIPQAIRDLELRIT